ncbi:YeeE/YedE family protein [Parapedobacter sp. ISTM3]|uniref:YeeE/YedE family protein n=1 Tax=Parapedobacter sp. ISTM3 TaxID=2800130 RepID=UPI0019088654|nr:YeeE/YedE thiosulfate transporter family protein [Parapedobacter sp. ISTM3]MBK1441475.1 YeeE/YedE family protein [Parapedobacter sp. ISTM3]
MIDFIKQPWPWYIAGPLVGLVVPALLILGNKHFGISANFRHICAACFPSGIKFFNYDYKKELWNLIFVAGAFGGGVIASLWLANPNPVVVDPALAEELAGYGISDYSNMVPQELYNWEYLLSVKGIILMVGGGFLVGFGSRYAGGCTSGHAIMGLSTLQWPSLVATVCFMAGGFLMANVLLPFILG